MESLFEVDPETNEIIYSESEVSESESGNISAENSSTGSILSSEEEVLETPELDSIDSDSGSVTVTLSAEQSAVLLASSPASGSLNSSTIDYFDRLVSGLPSNYCYVAFRNNTDDSYAGTIIYGKDFDCNGDTIVFGKGAVEIDVSRVTGSGYSSYIHYDALDASDSYVDISQSGNILYYTNAVEGYPILGDSGRVFDVSPFLVVGLISAMAVAVLSKLLNRRV